MDLDDNPPDASPLSVIVEHPVPLLPDDVLGLLPHDVLHHALELDGGAEVVEDLVLNLLMTLVDNLDGRNWKQSIFLDLQMYNSSKLSMIKFQEL